MPRTVVALALLLAAAPAVAQGVRVARLPDGTRVIHNRGAVPRPQPPPPAERADVDVRQVVEASARRHRLDPKLVDAVIRVESAYDPSALSRKGAMGLMQLMPETARELAIEDPWDATQNIAGGTAYLRLMLDRFGEDLELSLAAYNAGPSAVAAYRGIPPFPETRQYVRRVMAAYRDEPSYRLRGVAAPHVVARKTYLYRNAAGQLVLTTTPPAGR
ncbi:MAG: lytic transglycosylase domain-containing protein [Thermoanaerobaculia bacterium]|nr:lytic transglycosylase domain-containing protein [Thermoanaerobaculia bacterium]